MLLFAAQQVTPAPSVSFIIFVIDRLDTSVKAAPDVAANEPPAPKEEEEAAPEPVEDDSPPVSATERDPFEHMTPGCTKVATPLPELVPEYVQAVRAETEPEDSGVSGQVDTPLVELAPALPTPLSPTPTSPAPASTVPESPAPVSITPVSPVPLSLTEPEPEPEPEAPSKPR